jgi:hypothetical protein
MKGIYGLLCNCECFTMCVHSLKVSLPKPAIPQRSAAPPPTLLELATPLVLLPVERQRGTLPYILCEENREPWQHRLHLFNSVWALFTQPAAAIHHNTINLTIVQNAQQRNPQVPACGRRYYERTRTIEIDM